VLVAEGLDDLRPDRAEQWPRPTGVPAGQIISAAAGMPFTDYVHHVVLGPWGWTAPDSATGPDRATGYIRAPRITDPLLRRLLPHGIAGDRKGPFLALNPFCVDGPAYGGLIGDVVDASRFLRMHLNDVNSTGTSFSPRGRRAACAGSTTTGTLRPWNRLVPQVPANDTGDWVDHFGAGAGFWKVMRLYPDRGVGVDFGVVIMANATSRYDIEPHFGLLAVASWC